MTRDSLRRAASIAATLRHHGDEHHARAVEEMERQLDAALTERGAALSRVEAVLARLGVQDGDADPIRALESWAEEQHARDVTATDERNRFVTANAELGHLAVRQGYALRVLRGAVEQLRAAVGERDRAAADGAHDDTDAACARTAAAHTAVQGAFTALGDALDETADGAEVGEEGPDIAVAIEVLKPLASRAYRSVTLPAGVDAEKHLAEPIRPDFDADNHEAPRLVLALDLGGMQFDGDQPTPWQASVEYEGDLGIIPVVAGNASTTPLGALVSLRESLGADRSDEDADDVGSDD